METFLPFKKLVFIKFYWEIAFKSLKGGMILVIFYSYIILLLKMVDHRNGENHPPANKGPSGAGAGSAYSIDA